MSRVAIVTGGASGIGRATVELLESEGVKVAVFDRNGEIPVDVSDAAAVGRAVEEARGRLGPIDILVNAAGIGTGGPIDGEHYVEVWEQTLAVNLTAAMYLSGPAWTIWCAPETGGSSMWRRPRRCPPAR
jgi:NAD(P)-dependent dehydrogenase (short-subunit alcohol dehydrogenase family)